MGFFLFFFCLNVQPCAQMNTRRSQNFREASHRDASQLVCVSVDTGVDILRHVTAGGPMPMRKVGAEKETTVAMAMPSWSG